MGVGVRIRVRVRIRVIGLGPGLGSRSRGPPSPCELRPEVASGLPDETRRPGAPSWWASRYLVELEGDTC